jgi:hypothetical protein
LLDTRFAGVFVVGWRKYHFLNGLESSGYTFEGAADFQNLLGMAAGMRGDHAISSEKCVFGEPGMSSNTSYSKQPLVRWC